MATSEPPHGFISRGKCVFLFCIILVVSVTYLAMTATEQWHSAIPTHLKDKFVPQMQKSFQRFTNDTINNINLLMEKRFRHGNTLKDEKSRLKPIEGIRALAQNNSLSHTTHLKESTLEETIPDFVPRFLIKKEPTVNDSYADEKRYYHDVQYLQYLKCPTSVRRKMMTLPEIQNKYIVDMPVLMWDKHFTNSEYQRLNKFRGINGFDGTDTEDVKEALHLLASPNNRYMFDNKMKNGAPTGKCITCAVIGNGGILNGSKKGKEIDAHDYVFRVNTALTKGFEEDVGRRTSFYCFTLITLDNTLRGSRRLGFETPPYQEGIRYLFFADNAWTYEYLHAVLAGKTPPRSRGKYNRAPPKFPKELTKDNVKLIHPDFERYLKWSWVNSKSQHKDVHRPTTGAIMLLAALHTCDQVDIYGFGGSYSKFSEHYYDKNFQKHVFFANHDNIAENNLWERLHQLGIIQMYKRD